MLFTDNDPQNFCNDSIPYCAFVMLNLMSSVYVSALLEYLDFVCCQDAFTLGNNADNFKLIITLQNYFCIRKYSTLTKCPTTILSSQISAIANIHGSILQNMLDKMIVLVLFNVYNMKSFIVLFHSSVLKGIKSNNTNN